MKCVICSHHDHHQSEYKIRSNIKRYKDNKYLVWRCSKCISIHCETSVDLVEYYKNYPIRSQKLDYFLTSWFSVILKRLVQAGLEKQFIQDKGYLKSCGYDQNLTI